MSSVIYVRYIHVYTDSAIIRLVSECSIVRIVIHLKYHCFTENPVGLFCTVFSILDISAL